MHLIHHVLMSHSFIVVVRSILMTICVTSISYCGFAVYAARDFFARATLRGLPFQPGVTILKPLRGLDREAYENFASFCRQHYSNYEVIFGADHEDPAIAVANQIARDFPDVDIRIVVADLAAGANPKVGNLARMVPEAKYPLLLFSDSDIRVGPSHLETLVQPMADPRVGVVTCPYRSTATGFFGAMDALGLSTEFQPSVLVARKVEGISFGMGSGILIRRAVLEEVGGLAAISDYLADDYLLGNLPMKAGYGIELSTYVVEHRLDTSSLRELVDHQIRWNRGIRAVRPWGYAGLIFTQGVPAALLLLFFGGAWPLGWVVSGLALTSRLAMAWFVAVRCLDDRVARRAPWLVPLRDLLGFVLWLVAFFGETVVWRGSRFHLEKGGKLLPAPTTAADQVVAATRGAS